MQKLLEGFVKKMKTIYGNDLVSVILYGSAASGEFSKKFSNINLAVTLNDAGLANLSKARKVINSRRYRMFNVVFFTENYVKNSSDVFPIEFLDMKENHNLLYGKDILKDLIIDIRNLRFQCEQELKSKLLNIKRLYLQNQDKEALKALLFRSFTSVMHILRSLLKVKGASPAYLKEDILKHIALEFQIDETNLKKILGAKNLKTKLTYKDIDLLFHAFVQDLGKITELVDRL